MSVTDLATALAGSQVQETTGQMGVGFLKMDFETGEWHLGQGGDVVTDEEILVNTPTIMHGWILWSGGRPNKLFVSFKDVLPIPMPAIGDDHPSEGRSFQGALVDDGEPLAFDTNSYGGRKAVDVMLGKIRAHSDVGSTYLYPKVKLTSESYANKKRGGKTTYNPVFELVAWCNGDGKEETPMGLLTAKIESEPKGPAEPVETPVRRRRKRNTD
tara:strand:- start:3491 stop:4132 length:642 start_codon:yes stop_codon:yes gene_type:complete